MPLNPTTTQQTGPLKGEVSRGPRAITQYAGRALPEPNDVLAFPLDSSSDDQVTITWSSLALGHTIQTARYERIRCWFGSINRGLITQERRAASFKPRGETVIFVATEFLDTKYKNGPPCMRKYHLRETWGWENETWAYPIINCLYDFGQTSKTDPAFRYIVYHPPTILNAPPRDMFQHRFMPFLYTKGARSICQAASELPMDEAKIAFKVAGAGLDLLEYAVGDCLNQFANPTDSQLNAPLSAGDIAEIELEKKSIAEKAGLSQDSKVNGSISGAPKAPPAEYTANVAPTSIVAQGATSATKDPQTLSETDANNQLKNQLAAAGEQVEQATAVIDTSLEEPAQVPELMAASTNEVIQLVRALSLMQSPNPNRWQGQARPNGWRKNLKSRTVTSTTSKTPANMSGNTVSLPLINGNTPIMEPNAPPKANAQLTSGRAGKFTTRKQSETPG